MLGNHILVSNIQSINEPGRFQSQLMTAGDLWNKSSDFVLLLSQFVEDWKHNILSWFKNYNSSMKALTIKNGTFFGVWGYHKITCMFLFYRYYQLQYQVMQVIFKKMVELLLLLVFCFIIHHHLPWSFSASFNMFIFHSCLLLAKSCQLVFKRIRQL